MKPLEFWHGSSSTYTVIRHRLLLTSIERPIKVGQMKKLAKRRRNCKPGIQQLCRHCAGRGKYDFSAENYSLQIVTAATRYISTPAISGWPTDQSSDNYRHPTIGEPGNWEGSGDCKTAGGLLHCFGQDLDKGSDLFASKLGWIRIRLEAECTEVCNNERGGRKEYWSRVDELVDQ